MVSQLSGEDTDLQLQTNQVHVLLNVVVEWLTLLLRIREVPGSDLGPGYSD
jgi:hypothetical protein